MCDFYIQLDHDSFSYTNYLTDSFTEWYTSSHFLLHSLSLLVVLQQYKLLLQLVAADI